MAWSSTSLLLRMGIALNQGVGYLLMIFGVLTRRIREDVTGNAVVDDVTGARLWSETDNGE